MVVPLIVMGISYPSTLEVDLLVEKTFEFEINNFFNVFKLHPPHPRIFSFLYPFPPQYNSELCHVKSVNEITGFYHGMSRQTLVSSAIDLLCPSQKNYTVLHASTHTLTGIANYNPENVFVKTSRSRIAGCLGLVLSLELRSNTK